MRKIIIPFLFIALTATGQTIVGKNQHIIIPSEGDSVKVEVLAQGSTIVANHNIVLGVPVEEAETEGELLEKIDGKNLAFPELPTNGQVTKDVIYQYEGKAVICRQTHERTIYTPYATPALFSFYRDEVADMDWIPNEEVKIGTIRLYNGNKYECIQAHMTLEAWTPTATLGTLWKSLVVSVEWAAGVAYKVGDVITYQGSSYRCLQAHTSISTWYPSVVPVLWLKL